MAIDIKEAADGETLDIRIKGRFDFEMHEEFGAALERIKETKYKEYKIDFKEVTFIDSSAIGMLLLLRDVAGADNANIEIKHCNQEIREELEMANLHKLFSLT
jgi:anti-anti-sigma factor